ncbi:MAG: hypothetical protein Q9212_003146 [Teloschistes hypoglaucus]
MSSESLPPLQPSFVLRGHSAQVHAVHFLKDNTRLLTADAEGWLVSWSLASKRPVAVWKAHDDAILGIGSWGQDRIITHGRDSKLAVWQLGPDEEASIGKTLPVNKPPITTPHPWLLHMLTVNTLNFCQFAMCLDDMPQPSTPHAAIKDSKHHPPILVAVPNTMDSGGMILVPHFSAFTLLNLTLNRVRLNLVLLPLLSTDLSLVLSMAILPSRDGFLSSSADAVIAKHPLPVMSGVWKTELKPFKVIKTKHSGQQGLDVRSDGKIFATAGWDARVRVYSCKTLKELAVLKWHKVGCYATAFAEIAECCPVKTEPKLQVKQEDVPIKQEVEEEEEAAAPIIKQEEDQVENQGDGALTHQTAAVTTVQQRREAKAQSTHWLAAASKDGNVSLWDIY